MDSEEAEASADFFLREIPNVKISQTAPVSKTPVKEELKVLNLSEDAQEQILETLKYIHGPDFSLNNADSYEDKDNNFIKKYWTERGNLVVKGGVDYSQIKDQSVGDEERIKAFALMRLESYGFHQSHCVEAMKYAEGDIEAALYVLFSKYYGFDSSKDDVRHDLSEKELFEQRLDEKSSLESIYEKSFSEKVKNAVWIISLDLKYLTKIFHNKNNPTNKQENNRPSGKRKEKCKLFLAGNCKYGNKCRFSHEVPQIEKNINAHIEDFKYELEIRFPKDTKYPYEPPLIFLKCSALIPPLIRLHICKRLYEEAKSLAQDGLPSIYSVVELVQNEEEMLAHLKKEPKFIDKRRSLFESNVEIKRAQRPSHYKKGVTNRDIKKQFSDEEIAQFDRKLAEIFMLKLQEGRYIRMLKQRRTLPAYTFMQEILSKVRSSQVIVISGETGCGKSTQVPQYILDDWLANYSTDKRHVEIICTQPRRISALGVAERVADERVEKVGNSVGYQIRLESKLSANTRLLFCTTGILLRRLESEPTLPNVTHVIVDEVHERSVESDFLLLILKKLVSVRKDLKVVLMSATLNAELFSEYFGGAPVLNIPGRTFPVEQFFLEDILEVTDCVIEENSQYTRRRRDNESLDELVEMSKVKAANVKVKEGMKDENLSLAQIMSRYSGYSVKTCKQLYIIDPERINLDLIESVLDWIVFGDHEYPRTGSILIFLPGIAEITALYDHLNDNAKFSPKTGLFVLVPLHSSLSNEEQSAVFKTPREGVRKIVLSTNIAETSITIDDCVFVIDTGKMKEKHFDSNRNMESLETVWVTRANALQRKGRAGRVMSGVCVHLYTKNRFSHHMLPQPIPEIQRVPLEQLVLNIKVLPNFSGEELYEVLGSVIEPPVKESIDSAISRLQNVGALDKDNNLTPLGHHLASLPVDVRIGKLILYGAIFSCVDAALTMAACISYKSPFVSPFGKKDLADIKKRKFAVGCSDQLTVLMAYKKWLATNSKSRAAGYNFANENYLSVKTLQMLADIKHQFLELLVSIGFVSVNLEQRRSSGQDNVYSITGNEFNRNGENLRVLASVLCAALYPNVVKVMTPGKSFQMSVGGAVPKETLAKDLRLKTKEDWVFFHPSSVNYSVTNFTSPYLVYQEKVKTSKIYIRDCSMVPVIPLVLFSGFDVDISVNKGVTYLVLEEGWIVFKVEEHKVAEMIRMIRLELLELLEEKIEDPLLNLQHHDKGERIINTILNLITNE